MASSTPVFQNEAVVSEPRWRLSYSCARRARRGGAGGGGAGGVAWCGAAWVSSSEDGSCGGRQRGGGCGAGRALLWSTQPSRTGPPAERCRRASTCPGIRGEALPPAEQEQQNSSTTTRRPAPPHPRPHLRVAYVRVEVLDGAVQDGEEQDGHGGEDHVEDGGGDRVHQRLACRAGGTMGRTVGGEGGIMARRERDYARRGKIISAGSGSSGGSPMPGGLHAHVSQGGSNVIVRPCAPTPPAARPPAARPRPHPPEKPQ